MRKVFNMQSEKCVGAKEGGFLKSTQEIVVLLLIVFLIRTFGFGLYQVPTGSMETTMLKGERFFADKFTPIFSKPKHGEIIAFNDPTFKFSRSPLIKLFQEYVWGPTNWTKRVIGVPGDEIKGVIEDGKPVVYRNGKKLDEPYINKYPLTYEWQERGLKLSRIKTQFQSRLAEFSLHGEEGKKAIDELYYLMRYSWYSLSYDPSRSLEDQPFYSVNKEYHVMNPEKKPYLLYPNQPLRKLPGAQTTRKGKNHWNGSDEYYVKLGPDEYWMMGDNRLGSYDCRAWGPLKERLIHAKIIFRILSIDMRTKGSWLDSVLLIYMIKHPIDFWKQIRWSRWLQPVR